MSAGWIVLLVVAIGCGAAAPAPPPPPPAAPDTTTTDIGGGRCNPEPNEGRPCGKADPVCVVSWGLPGGSSAALWCRNGRWELEEERNLPDPDH